MHELSIASSIVDIANESVANNNGCKVIEIEIEIGKLSGVVLEALEFAAEIAFKNTVLENAKINYIHINGRATCEECYSIFEAEDFFTSCPNCNSFKNQIIEGKELKVKSLIID